MTTRRRRRCGCAGARRRRRKLGRGGGLRGRRVERALGHWRVVERPSCGWLCRERHSRWTAVRRRVLGRGARAQRGCHEGRLWGGPALGRAGGVPCEVHARMPHARRSGVQRAEAACWLAGRVRACRAWGVCSRLTRIVHASCAPREASHIP
eukprot:5351092-Prymnesium_polylepis.1